MDLRSLRRAAVALVMVASGVTAGEPESASKPPEFEVVARIVSIPPVPNPRHNVYASCVVLARLEVLEQGSGDRQLPPEVVAGFWGFRDRELEPAADYRAGQRLVLTLIPMVMADETVRSTQRIGEDETSRLPVLWTVSAEPVPATAD